MIIEFKYLEFKNFLSYGQAVKRFDFTSFNNLLIYGSNGAGKSTILEVLFYNLFGTPYRKGIVLSDLINNINQKELQTKCCFKKGKDEYLIERNQKPGLLCLYKNNIEVLKNVSNTEFQKTIDEVLGCNYEVFKQICVIDSKFFVPFMDLGASKKREIIDCFFELDLISSLNEKIKVYKVQNETAYKDIIHKIDLINNEIKIVKNKNKEQKEEIIKILNSEILDFQKSLESLSKPILEKKAGINEKSKKKLLEETKLNDTKKSILEKESELQSKLKKLSSKESDINISKLNLKNDIKNLELNIKYLKNMKCDKCFQDIEHVHSNKKQEEFNTKISEINKNILLLEDDINNILLEKEISQNNWSKEKLDLDNILNEIQKTYSLLQKDEQDLTIEYIKLESEQRNYNKRILDNTNKINSLSVKEPQSEEISSLESKLKSEIENKEKKELIKSIIDQSLSILSDTGVRTYIYDRYLPIINNLIQENLEVMGSNIRFKLDNDLGELINPKYKNQKKYYQLSMGQKTRINFAILFSFLNFIEKMNGIKINILMFDEVLEGSLDAEGKESLIDIIQTRLHKKIILISHDQEMKNHFQNSIEVKNVNGFSQF